jgi:hypothetical protein
MGRGMAQKSKDLIDFMYTTAKAIQPVTGRGIGIPSMSKDSMYKVYRLLKIAREQGAIPWEWIVDESRRIERVGTWANPASYAKTVARSYRLDFWNQQPHRVLVLSEKGTVRGVLAPTLNHYAVGFLPIGGFSSATKSHDLAIDDDGRLLILLYVGDYDPSGMFMSEQDLPNRFAKYGGSHIRLERIALTHAHVHNARSPLSSFPAADKIDDPRYAWFTRNYGNTCWELDAMDPNDLRACVERKIKSLIEPTAWALCETVYAAELDSLKSILGNWGTSAA